MKCSKIILTTIFLSQMSACANMQKAMDESNERIRDKANHTESVKNRFAERKEDIVLLSDDGLWVSPKSKPAALEKPDVLKENIAISKGSIGLDEISEEITRRLGIPVKLGPEIILSMKSSSSNTSSSTMMNTSSVVDPMAMNLSDSQSQNSNLGNTTQQSISPIDKSVYYTSLTYRGNLEGLLDILSARMNISWEIDARGELKLYRYLTKTFVIAAPHGQSEFDIGSETEGTSSSDSSTSTTDSSESGTSSIVSKTSSTQSPWTNTAAAVQTFLSYEGRAAINEAAGTITVTDVKLVVDRIGDFIKQQNDNYLRQAAISVTVYSVESTDDIGYGVDWSLIYKKLTDYSLSTAAPVSVLGTGTGSVSAMILEDSNNSSTFAGTNALFEALRSQGEVTTVTSGSVLALNHRPSSIRLGVSEGYLKSTSTTSTANVGSTTALEDGTVNTGSVMAVLPNIVDAERLTLQMSINISALLGQIKEFTSGSESLFAPKKSIMEINYPVSLKTGQTLVLGGLEDNSDTRNENSTGDSIALGGSRRNQVKKSSIVVVVKSVIL